MQHDRFLRLISVFLCIFTMILGIAVFRNIRAVEDENAITRKTTYNAAALVRRELKNLQETEQETIPDTTQTTPDTTQDVPTDTEAVAKTSCFVLREQDGILCVFDEKGVLKRNTGISVRSLPDADRASLHDGICVYSEEELAMLIGDLST
ncbi:putative uncharacterized protein [Clostridium sp. CAG:448]|nr:putative uncharacterized protein [Clostridium sp. CAG:448]